ncbi:MAG: diacylglycerol kinase family lipid kinase [Candidatus Cloacimonetes bacterium]|nr:diacylglycerol kinase family lipid kinase [Candidatus Cloacimonadota bacterium]
MAKWFFIVNSTAGNGRTGKKINDLINLLNQERFDFRIELTRYAKHGIELAREAALEGFEYIIAVGGDGTASEVAGGIMSSGRSSEVKFGIIPEGGGNDFCRNFHLSSNLEKCLQQLIEGRILPANMAKIEDNYVLNSLGIGFDAQAALYANKIKWLNGLPRYMLAVFIAMLHFRNFRLRIIIDDEREIKGKFLLLAAGNGKFAGGGFKLTPDALVDDNYLDIMLAEDVTFLRLFKVLPKALEGLHTSEKEVSIFRCRKLEVFSEIDLPLYFDGEIPDLNNKRHIKVELLSEKINLLVP